MKFKMDWLRLPFFISLAASLTLMLGLATTAGLFVWAARLEFAKEEFDFQRSADIQLAIVKEGLDNAVDELKRVNQLFAVIDPVSREQFHAFIQPFLVNTPHSKAFSFERLISAAERPAYEAEMRRTFPHFMVTELIGRKPVHAGARENYRVVDYLEPLDGNEVAFGLDASTIPNQDDATRRARDTGLPSATSLYKIGQEPNVFQVFFVVMPVYRRHVALGDAESRRRAVVGYTVAKFHVADLVEKVLTAGGVINTPGINVNVFVGKRLDDASLAFRHSGAPFHGTAAFWLPAWLFADSTDSRSQTFDVGGKSWHMAVSAMSSAPQALDHIGSLVVLIAGLLFSSLAAMYMQKMTSRSQRIQRMVDDRTAELRSANEMLTRDIDARERAEQALRLRDRALEASTNAVIITSAQPPDFRVEYVNPAFERMTGYTADEVIGRSVDAMHGDDGDGDGDQPGVAELQAAVREKREGHVTLRDYRKDGAMYWSEVYLAPVKALSGEISHFVTIKHDITETKRYQAELEFHASRDVLTGLPNRNLLRDRLNQAISYGGRYGHPIWAVFVNLDRFTLLNNTLGHQTGDALLKTIAARLQLAVRESDTVARIGGDEFVLVLPERTDERLKTDAVQRIMEAVAQPLAVEEREYFLTCSVGVAIYPIDGEDAETLITHASIAMHRVKESGGNNFQFYTPAMNEQAQARLRIVADLRNALERQELVLHYQPQVDLRTGRIVGMEALILWNHPELGLLPPSRFLGLAEETAMIVPIGAWLLRTACRQNKTWQDAGLDKFRVAVNLSGRQFAHPDLAQSIVSALQETGLEPCYLDIELTESMVMTEVDQTMQVMSKLKLLGVQLSIDDFGTGYSSLAYLKRLPIDALKIDRSFVRNIAVDAGDAAIAKAIVSMAHTMGIRVIAEGVETEQQCDFLRQHMCDELQGSFFSEPLAAVKIEALLRQGRCLPEHLLRWQEPLRTLLIVDDEVNIVAALKRLLRRDSYRILTANSGQEGLDILTQYEYQVDVIVSDQRMPGMTGVEFLRKAKDLYPDTVRIVLSGYTELQSVTDAINEGAIYKFLTKPWDDAQLRVHIEEAFRHKQLADENQRLHLEVQTANQELAASNRKLSEMVNLKQQQIVRDEVSLNIVREALQQVPLPVIGLDEDDVVAFANDAAQALFQHSGPILGSDAAQLMPELSHATRGSGKEARFTMILNGLLFEVVSHNMGHASQSRGKLMTLTRCEVV
jgi:diguanylate cyclase (GGDEF)-like protein/PAS domain S-box-containing protein